VSSTGEAREPTAEEVAAVDKRLREGHQALIDELGQHLDLDAGLAEILGPEDQR
jgi:hypothetical protein